MTVRLNPPSDSMKNAAKPALSRLFSFIGPGLVVAAAGIGAGDVITATVTGARFGTTLLWAIVLTAVLKFLINENLTRWQLATGTTLIAGWIERLPRIVPIYFGFYLLLWTFLVGGSLSNACALAGHSLFPGLPVAAWGAIHSLAAVALVWWGRFDYFQTLMKTLVGLMAIIVVVCAGLLWPGWSAVLSGVFVPTLPAGGGRAVLGVFGGIGGSVTLMCYGYWIRENGWRGNEQLKKTWGDLGLAYTLTALFGISLSIIASNCSPDITQGTRMALDLAAQLEIILGPAGRWAMLLGFWCCTFTAMLGVWQGVPYLFDDFVASWKNRDRAASSQAMAGGDRQSPVYRAALLYLASPPLTLLYFRQPVLVVVAFTIAGAFVMPFLAGTLLYMNNRRDWVGEQRNPWWLNAGLVIALGVFGYVCYAEVSSVLK